MFGLLRNEILACGLSLALAGAFGAGVAIANPTAPTSDVSDAGGEAPEPRLFTVAEVSFFFENLVTNDDLVEQLSELSTFTEGSTETSVR